MELSYVTHIAGIDSLHHAGDARVALAPRRRRLAGGLRASRIRRREDLPCTGMIRRLGTVLQTVLGLALLLVLVAGIGWVVYSTVTRAPAVVAAVVTGLAALFGLGVQKYLEQQREDARERRARMAPIYEKLVRTFYKSAGGAGPVETELREFFDELAQGLLVWGSEPVINAWNEWRASVAGEEPDEIEGLFSFERLLYAIREDLGNESKVLGRGDLLRVFVNDIDDYLVIEAAARELATAGAPAPD